MSKIEQVVVSGNSANTDAQIRHVYDRWHETILSRDLDGACV
jgi:hypothetical protein